MTTELAEKSGPTVNFIDTDLESYVPSLKTSLLLNLRLWIKQLKTKLVDLIVWQSPAGAKIFPPQNNNTSWFGLRQ